MSCQRRLLGAACFFSFGLIPSLAHASDSFYPAWTFRPSLTLEAPTVMGIEAGATRIAGTTNAQVGVGMSLGLYSSIGPIDVRMTQHAAIAGGGQGAEGWWTPEVALGHRFDFLDQHGIVARLGASGAMQGNDRVWITSLTTPEVQLGYQFHSYETLFELGVRGGLTLASRFEVDGVERAIRPTSPTYGAYAAFGYGPLWLEGAASRIDSHDALESPVDRADASACFRYHLLAVCAGGRTTWARIPVPTSPTPDTKAVSVSTFYGVVGLAL